MANRSKVLEFTKRGRGTGEGWEIDLIDILKHPRTGTQVAEISSVAATYLEKRTATAPETWADVTSQVSIGGVSVTTGEGTNSAVKGVLAMDKDNTPPAGDGYRLHCECILNNGQGEDGYADVRIIGSAAVPSV